MYTVFFLAAVSASLILGTFQQCCVPTQLQTFADGLTSLSENRTGPSLRVHVRPRIVDDCINQNNLFLSLSFSISLSLSPGSCIFFNISNIVLLLLLSKLYYIC